MASYDVLVQDQAGRLRDCCLRIQAASPSEAVICARASLPPGADGHVYAVYRHRRARHRRARHRRLVGVFAGLGPGDDGSAGVREPRRPLPAPPSLRAEASPPAYREG